LRSREVRQEGFRTGVREASSRDVQRVAENEELNCVEGSAFSETEEEPTRSFSVRGAENVGISATLGTFAPTGWKKKKNFG
jgi:hypothetical protein